MLACNDHEAGRHPLYKGSVRISLCRLPSRLTLAIALAGAISAAGCSLPLDSMFDKNDAVFEQVDATGSVHRGVETAEAGAPSEGDLAYARAAAVDAMAHGVKDSNTPWNNPDSGASGNITPLGTAYSLGDLLCRGFLASYARGSAQAWLHGEACRTASGQWEVKSLRPLSRG